MESQTSKMMYRTVATQPTDDEEWGIEHPVLASAQPVGNQTGSDILPELKNYNWSDDYFQDDNNVIAVFDHDYELIQKEETMKLRILCFGYLVYFGGLAIIIMNSDSSDTPDDTPDDVDGLGYTTGSLLFWIHVGVFLLFTCCFSFFGGSLCGNNFLKPHIALTSEGVLCCYEPSNCHGCE